MRQRNAAPRRGRRSRVRRRRPRGAGRRRHGGQQRERLFERKDQRSDAPRHGKRPARGGVERHDPETEIGRVSVVLTEEGSEDGASPESRHIRQPRGGGEARTCRAILQAAVGLVERDYFLDNGGDLAVELRLSWSCAASVCGAGPYVAPQNRLDPGTSRIAGVRLHMLSTQGMGGVASRVGKRSRHAEHRQT